MLSASYKTTRLPDGAQVVTLSLVVFKCMLPWESHVYHVFSYPIT
jgi:hypothetical protein